jgi:uracil phosphoribosyltransferase
MSINELLDDAFNGIVEVVAPMATTGATATQALQFRQQGYINKLIISNLLIKHNFR